VGLAVREGWETERGGATTMRGLKGTISWMMRGIYMPPASNGSSRLWRMVEGGSGLRVLSLGGLKARSVEEAVARITGEADDREAEGKKRRMVRIRMVARIRAGGGMTRTQQHTMCMWMVRDMSCRRTRTYC
jgi:hypothetical protein